MNGIETVPAPHTSSGPRDLPRWACDTHSHIFGPFNRFPPLRPAVYALPDAGAADHEAARRRMGVVRGVLTQATPYADDPALMLDAVARSRGRLKAVAVAGPAIDEAKLASWRANGIMGLRFTEMRAPDGGPYPGSEPFESLLAMAPALRRQGLHAQLWASAEQLAEWLPRLLPLDLPLVIDHMGCPNVAHGVEAAPFRAIVDALESGRVWVKLVLARVARHWPDCADARPFHDALVAAAPERMLWGSDWPYVRMNPTPDAGHMLRIFCQWVADPAIRRRILSENPARLYDFAGDD